MKPSLMIALATASLLGLGGCLIEPDRIPDSIDVPPPPSAPSDDSYAAGSGSPDAQSSVDSAPPAPGSNVDDSTFYDRLSPYGHWRWTPDYGRVWVPTVASDWRPYTYGNWEYTDDGWTFASDDPWGWAAYHYGSWGYGADLGWYWLPGSIWAPAWVDWRWGDGYACWSPIGPDGYGYGYNSPAWVVVGQQHFTQPIVGNVVAPGAAGAIVASAHPLAGAHASPSRGGQFGPPVAQVSAAVGHSIATVPVSRAIGHAGPATASGHNISPLGSPRGGGTRGSPASANPLRSPRPVALARGSAAWQGAPHYGMSSTGRPYTSPAPRTGWDRGGPIAPATRSGSAQPRGGAGWGSSGRSSNSGGRGWGGGAARSSASGRGWGGGGARSSGGGRGWGGGGGARSAGGGRGWGGGGGARSSGGGYGGGGHSSGGGGGGGHSSGGGGGGGHSSSGGGGGGGGHSGGGGGHK